ncbi:M12 family metallo-peptidase [Streptomyces sp. NBC_01485]|uniref:M12 family metallo-peptidase n=1 Tax=Streptomyces sp. NBC_01485 TaxID=2903884 RepID=UPI002E380583|nr:M12 family metallo-peptidase [Streptomyces sp. NBC_01485]
MALRLRILAALVAAAGLLLTAAPPAESATGPVYAGRGWKVWTDNGIYSLNPDPYTIVFADTAARTKLKPYLLKPAAQASTVTGVQITVTDLIDTTPAGTCPARHQIIVSYSYRPTGEAGMSQARACHQIDDGSAWGGHMLIDSEYWTSPNWFSTDAVKNDAYRWNVITHELGHSLGLAHATEDLNGDGTVKRGECVATATGTKPIMCDPQGGYLNPTDAGRFTPPFDEPGLRQLAANWYLR